MKNVAIRGPLLHPAMREATTEQHAVPLAKRTNMIAHITQAGASSK
jgi:hypothetical protein